MYIMCISHRNPIGIKIQIDVVAHVQTDIGKKNSLRGLLGCVYVVCDCILRVVMRKLFLNCYFLLLVFLESSDYGFFFLGEVG